jgi:hypothetical protein
VSNHGRTSGLSDFENDTCLVAGIEVAKATAICPFASSYDWQAQAATTRFGFVAVFDLKTEVINTFTPFIEKPLLRRVQNTGVAQLYLDIVKVHALIAHSLGCFLVGNLKLQILARLRVVEPWSHPKAFIIGYGLLKVFDDDADMVKVLVDGVHVDFSILDN